MRENVIEFHVFTSEFGVIHPKYGTITHLLPGDRVVIIRGDRGKIDEFFRRSDNPNEDAVIL